MRAGKWRVDKDGEGGRQSGVASGARWSACHQWTARIGKLDQMQKAAGNSPRRLAPAAAPPPASLPGRGPDPGLSHPLVAIIGSTCAPALAPPNASPSTPPVPTPEPPLSPQVWGNGGTRTIPKSLQHTPIELMRRDRIVQASGELQIQDTDPEKKKKHAEN